MELGQIGRYEVIRSLGQGGMGQVYLARDPKLERQVAIKLLHRDDGPTRALFEREAKALAALAHPNIVTIFEIAEIEDGRQFLAMEYLPGRSLRDLLLHARPPREDLVAICGQVALALAAAHEAGILHRDIKPENVVVGKALSVKVVDFGIARRLDAPPSVDPDQPRPANARAVELVDMFTRTLPVGDPTLVTDAPATRTVFGTPAYMAPEVLMGEPSSVASDVYSLGVLLHECLAGRRPYEAPALHELIARIVDGGDAPTQLDDPLGPLVARMIAREPAERPALTEIAKALARRRSVAVAPPPRARTPWLLILAPVTLAIAAGVLLWPRDDGPTEPAPQPVAKPRRSVAIRQLDTVTLPSYGTAPDPKTFTSTLEALIETAGVVVRPPDQSDQAVDLIIGGTIVESGGVVTAQLDVREVATKTRTTRTLTGKADQVAALLHKVAVEILTIAAPGVELGIRDRALSQKLTRLGSKDFTDGQLTARTYLEQAVAADDSNAEAWDRYAAALAMTAAKHERVVLAAERALQLAPEGSRKQILYATLLVYRGEFARALELIAPLEPKLATLAPRDRRDLLFQLGECHWHEGRHDQGFAYFKRTLELDPNYTEATRHAGEYALVRREEALALQYISQQRMDLAFVDFAMGRYERLVDHPIRDFARWSRIVLGRPPGEPLAPEIELHERIAERAGAGDRAAVEQGVATVLARLEPFTDYTASQLIRLGEVLIAAELAPQTRAVLDALRAHRPTYGFKRLSILAAPLLGAPRFSRDQLTERLATLQQAIEAELAGDRPTAAKLLGALVANPTYEWDFVERLALRRNLLALRRTREAAALCADTLKPPVMRQVFHVVRARCRS